MIQIIASPIMVSLAACNDYFSFKLSFSRRLVWMEQVHTFVNRYHLHHERKCALVNVNWVRPSRYFTTQINKAVRLIIHEGSVAVTGDRPRRMESNLRFYSFFLSPYLLSSVVSVLFWYKEYIRRKSTTIFLCSIYGQDWSCPAKKAITSCTRQKVSHVSDMLIMWYWN